MCLYIECVCTQVGSGLRVQWHLHSSIGEETKKDKFTGHSVTSATLTLLCEIVLFLVNKLLRPRETQSDHLTSPLAMHEAVYIFIYSQLSKLSSKLQLIHFEVHLPAFDRARCNLKNFEGI